MKTTGALVHRSDSKGSGNMPMNSDFSTKRKEALKDSKPVNDLNRFGFCIPGSHVEDELARGDTRS